MFAMLALFTAYCLYEADANNWWWTIYWIIVGVSVVQMMFAHREKKAKEIAESRNYWEGKK
jgi:accessory gene regulator protein AgrB